MNTGLERLTTSVCEEKTPTGPSDWKREQQNVYEIYLPLDDVVGGRA